MNDVKVVLGEERIISFAPPDVHEWGPWQFPTLDRDRQGRLYLSFHQDQDHLSGYGSEPCRYLSDDNGITWQPTKQIGGLIIDDSTMVRPATVKALDVNSITLPEAVTACKYCYVKDVLLYDMDEVDPAYKKWYRWISQNSSAKLEEIKVNAPGYLMRMSNELFIQPFFYAPYFYRKNENTIMAVSYHPLRRNGHTGTYFDALYFESTDDARSFNLISSIAFLPPYGQIPDSMNCQGFLEPSLCFTDENTAFTLLRTTCVKGISPMFISWSHDGCKTWSQPEYFDEHGVFPQCMKLDNGVVLAGYGRPGLYIRAMHNNCWTEKKVLVSPGELTKDTCSYCGIAPIGKNKAVVVYSRFDVKDELGRVRKAMLVRDITIE